jgi:hypothetical protein
MSTESAMGNYEEIIMNNNTKYVGELTGVTQDKIEILTELGTEISLNRGNISSEKIVEKDGSYLSVAATLGMPAVLNVLGQYTVHNWAFGIEGLYLPNASGVQASGGFLLTKLRYFQQILKLNLGYSRMPSSSNSTDMDVWSYFGPSYTFQLNNFIVDAGITVGQGSYTNPQFFFQIGYIQNFN